LAYVAALQTGSDRAARLCVRFFALRMLASVVTIAVAIGAADAPKATVSVATLTLAPWSIVVAGSLTAALLLVLEFPQWDRAHRLAYEAVGIFRDELGYRRPWTAWKAGEGPWGVDIASAARSDTWIPRSWTDLGMIIALSGVALLTTVGAQGFAWAYLRSHESATAAWAFAPVPVCTLAFAAVRYLRIGLEVRGHRRPHLALGKWREELPDP
jgi:hypothetical protein